MRFLRICGFEEITAIATISFCCPRNGFQMWLNKFVGASCVRLPACFFQELLQCGINLLCWFSKQVLFSSHFYLQGLHPDMGRLFPTMSKRGLLRAPEHMLHEICLLFSVMPMGTCNFLRKFFARFDTWEFVTHWFQLQLQRQNAKLS